MIVDRATGVVREAEIFVAVLGASNYTYAEATWTQKLADWIEAHVRMFRFFGGVPRLVVPDNLKSGVHRASFYDPEINRSYGMMASHYGVVILPARPRKPRDKAKVEAGVRSAQTYILGRLRRQTFFSLAEANAAIAAALERINAHVMHRLVEALKAALIIVRAEAAAARAQQSDDQALIARLKLQIEKLNRDRYGQRSERAARLLDQLELTLEELETAATEDELAAEMAATTKVASFTRKRPSRQPFPEHLPRERVIVPGPVACACCGGARISRLGEDITETLEVVPKSWKVIQHVREKFTCRDCEKISQAPAPFHVIARGWAGPSLLAMVLFEMFGQHQPLNRQAERYGREGVPINLSTLADQVGGCTAALMPLFKCLETYALSAERLHGDDTTVPVLAKGKTDTGRIWVCARRQAFWRAGPAGGCVLLLARSRRGASPGASGRFQRDRPGRRLWRLSGQYCVSWQRRGGGLVIAVCCS